MFEKLKSILFPVKPDFKQLVAQGAIILDVRTPKEYASGHIKGSLNIPVQNLSKDKLKKMPIDKHIITCCASGVRSHLAKKTIISYGYTNVYNGGA